MTARAENNAPARVRTDQPTIVTLEETMATAVYWARKAFTDAGFTGVELVITVVATSLDPDDDHTTWTAASRVTAELESDRSQLAASLRLSAEECET